MTGTTMHDLTYGISSPHDLLAKLEIDASKLGSSPAPADVFNFVVTAAVLNEWTRKYYKSEPIVVALASAQDSKIYEQLPPQTSDWLLDRSCLPSEGFDPRMHVLDALSICWHTANASKHFHWTGSSKITTITAKPPIRDWYQYFFTGTQDDLYVEIDERHYGLSQISGILLQFYRGLLAECV
jgi:hypothetical protein